jgi:uncharacterized protein DUF4124
MLRALLLITSLLFAGTVSAQYKWVDKDGKVQYGDTPPAGAAVSVMRRASPPSRSQPEASDRKDDAKKGPISAAEKDAEFRKRRHAAEQEREKQAKAQQDAADKRENCARAQENMRMLETGRVARTDAKGERYYLNDAQIQQETARARQSAREWCS